MMKKLLFCLLVLAGAGTFHSCQQDDVVNEAVATKGATIRATLPGDVQSRLALGEAVNGNFPVYWEADDKITVEIGGETYTFSILEHDKNNATFYCEDAPANLPKTTVAYEFVYNSNTSGTLDCLKMKASVDTANGAIAWKDVTLEFIATSAVVEVALPAGVSATKVSLYNSTNGALITAVTAPTDGSITDKAYMAVDATEIVGAIILAETSDKVYIAEVGQAELIAGKLYQITKEMAEATPGAGGETDEVNVKYAVVNGNAYVYGTGAMKEALFKKKTNITRAVILQGVTNIAITAFFQCSNLTNVTLPNTLVKIEGGAFSNCSNLTNVTLPNTLVKIEDSAFSGCANINTIEIPSSVTSIGNYAFQNCSGLTNVVIPEGVTSLGSGVFNVCSNLVSVTIPSTLTSCGSDLFQNCTNLKTVNLKDGLNKIYDGMFYKIPSLESITIPSSVTSIGESAFKECTGLQNVIIKEETGKGLQNISKFAFYNTGLRTINLPSTLTTIGVSSFVSCNNLESITIPANVTSIDKSAFDICRKLLSVTCQATTPPTLGSSAFDYNADGRKIYVPSASVDDYKAAENWSTYVDYIEAIP